MILSMAVLLAPEVNAILVAKNSSQLKSGKRASTVTFMGGEKAEMDVNVGDCSTCVGTGSSDAVYPKVKICGSNPNMVSFYSDDSCTDRFDHNIIGSVRRGNS